MGGGPSGSATALAFLQKSLGSLKVAVADKAAFPRDKACGDGLGPGVVSALRSLGVDWQEIPRAHPVRHAEVHGPNRVAVRTDLRGADLESDFGLTVRRLDFDDFLLRQAASAGVETLLQCRFLGYERTDGSSLSVRFLDLKTNEEFTKTCKLLVGADGANSRVRRATGISSSTSKQTGIAIRAYADVPHSWTDRIILSYEDALRPGYGWMFPLGTESGRAVAEANVGCGILVSDLQKSKANLSDLLNQYLEVLRERGFECSAPRDHSTYTLPCGILQKFTADGVALVGDAASMINPLSGEGIVYGMKAGTLLADCAAEALDGCINAEINAALAQYEKVFRKTYKAHFRSTAIAKNSLRSKVWTRVFLKAAMRCPKTRADSINLMFGDSRITFASVLRALRHGLFGKS